MPAGKHTEDEPTNVILQLYTLNPQPSTLNPKPETLSPNPETRNPKPYPKP